MVGNRWEGWGRGGRELDREAWLSLCLGPGRYCEGGGILSDAWARWRWKIPGGWRGIRHRAFPHCPLGTIFEGIWRLELEAV